VENAKSFDIFMENVRSSVGEHAERKGYSHGGPDGGNQLLQVDELLGIRVAHGIGEIVYKSAEYLRTPRRVLLEKIAGWAFCLWREHKDES
jgi:hypothetical protein